MTTRPDILLLVLDTQRIDRLSCYGHHAETSPHLDAFAADATRFRHAYAAGQWTVPSHTSMFTGLYPGRHHMFHAYSMLPDTLTTLSERLGRNGYFTAGFCNNPLIGVVNTGLHRGFQSFLSYSGLMTSRPHQTREHLSVFDRYRRHFKRFLASGLTAAQDYFAHSDTLLDLSFSPLLAPIWQTAVKFKGNTPKTLNDAAKLHIERKGIEKDQPIFSFINLMGTHTPYHPPLRFVERFAPHVKQDKAEQRYLRQFNSDVFGWLAPLITPINEEHKTTLDGIYDAEVAYQDELVGAFLQKLRTSGVLDHTLVIVCADHGDHLGEKQLMGHSISLYNELVHVPLIIRAPNGDFPRGTTVDSVVSTRRVFHTALTAADLGTEQEQALSLAQSAEGDPDHGTIFAMGVTPKNLLNIMERRRPDLVKLRQCDQTRYALWNGQHKLIQTDDANAEVFDIFDDPYEQHDLRAILPEQAKTLQKRLHTFMNHIAVADTTETEETEEFDDPQVYRRLRDLGYLE
ncbi:MAG: sulfatase [Ktedonobacteraceae bacterium]